jgi:hypothetical protein
MAVHRHFTACRAAFGWRVLIAFAVAIQGVPFPLVAVGVGAPSRQVCGEPVTARTPC